MRKDYVKDDLTSHKDLQATSPYGGKDKDWQGCAVQVVASKSKTLASFTASLDPLENDFVHSTCNVSACNDSSREIDFPDAALNN